MACSTWPRACNATEHARAPHLPVSLVGSLEAEDEQETERGAHHDVQRVVPVHLPLIHPVRARNRDWDAEQRRNRNLRDDGLALEPRDRRAQLYKAEDGLLQPAHDAALGGFIPPHGAARSWQEPWCARGARCSSLREEHAASFGGSSG
eukprot:7164813-Prymnesium_polylepis.1